MRMIRSAIFMAAALALAGCSITGLDASNKFACAAPEGVSCESMSGVYANMMAQRSGARPGSKGNVQELATEVSQAKGTLSKPIYSGTPIRTAPEVLRVWIAPWEDADEDLHDQAFVYLPIDSGRWLIEHNKRRIMEAYAPVRKPKGWKERQESDSQPTSNLKSGDGKAILNMGAAGAEQAKNYINQMFNPTADSEFNQ